MLTLENMQVSKLLKSKLLLTPYKLQNSILCPYLLCLLVLYVQVQPKQQW